MIVLKQEDLNSLHLRYQLTICVPTCSFLMLEVIVSLTFFFFLLEPGISECVLLSGFFNKG